MLSFVLYFCSAYCKSFKILNIIQNTEYAKKQRKSAWLLGKPQIQQLRGIHEKCIIRADDGNRTRCGYLKTRINAAFYMISCCLSCCIVYNIFASFRIFARILNKYSHAHCIVFPQIKKSQPLAMRLANMKEIVYRLLRLLAWIPQNAFIIILLQFPS